MDTNAPANGFDLLRGAAHLLRTPLGVVLGTASTLRDYDARFTPQQRVRYLTEVIRAADEMKAALDGLSLLARVMDGSLPFNIAPVQLGQLAAEGSAVLKAAWSGHGCDVRILLPGTAQADSQRLVQALEALGRISTPRDGVVLEVGVDTVPYLLVGPVSPVSGAEQLQTLLSGPLDGISVAETVAGPAGWPLLLARHLLDAQWATLRVEPDANDGAFSLRIDLAPAGR